MKVVVGIGMATAMAMAMGIANGNWEIKNEKWMDGLAAAAAVADSWLGGGRSGRERRATATDAAAALLD